MQKVHAACHGGREANAVIGPKNIVVHGLGNGDHRKPFAMESFPIPQGVVAADGNQNIQPQRLQIAQDAGSAIQKRAVPQPLPAGVLQKAGQVFSSDLTRVGSGGVQEGASRSVDGTNDGVFQLEGTSRQRARILGIEEQQPAPPAPYSEHLVTCGFGPIDHRLDAGIQSGNVAASCQDSNAHGSGPEVKPGSPVLGLRRPLFFTCGRRLCFFRNARDQAESF